MKIISPITNFKSSFYLIKKIIITSTVIGLFAIFNVTYAGGIPTLDIGAIANAIKQLEQAKKAYQNQLRQHEGMLRGQAHDLLKYDKEFWKTDIDELNRKLEEVNDMLDFYKKEYASYADTFVRKECNTYDECLERKDEEETAQIQSNQQAVISVQKELENQAENLSQTQNRTQLAQKASLEAENQLQAIQANTAMQQLANEQLSEIRRLLIMQINMQKTVQANEIKEHIGNKESHDNLTNIGFK